VTTSPSLITGRQRVILLVLLGAGFMLSVDFSILNVALPEVGAGAGMGLSWQAAFFINAPVALVILLLTPFVISESRLPDRVKLDLPGAVTVTGGLLAVNYAVIERNLPSAVIGVLLLAAFWMIELRSPAPLVPVRILKRPTVKWGNYAGFVVFTMETAMIFLTTLYLQQTLGFSPLATGLI
jgi:hypothetical protein